MHVLKNICIVTKSGLEPAQALGGSISDWLQRRGVGSVLMQASQVKECQLAKDVQSADLLLVLGGDGTILSLARRVLPPVPLLGINFGRVGFLTELTVENWKKGLDQVLHGEWRTVSYLTLSYELWRSDQLVGQGRAVNDLVVSRGGKARLLDLALKVDGEHLGLLRGDGLIVSTPLGSTAYAVAAGGALLMPGLDVIELCPICPFLQKIPPLVLPEGVRLQVTVDSVDGEAFLTLDGQSGERLCPSDKIYVSRSASPVLFARLPTGLHYFEKLSQKGYF